MVFTNNNSLDLESRKAALFDYLVTTFQLSDCSKLKTALKSRLCKSFYNNLQKRLNKLRKNEKNFENFEVFYKSWLDNNFNFSFSDNILNYQADSGKKCFFNTN